jgi:plasmid stabilization system protein ParE
MTGVRWTEQAVKDLASIRSFIERDSPRYGRIVVERIFEATDRLETFPRSGRMVPELGREDLRELLVATLSTRIGGFVNLTEALHNTELLLARIAEYVHGVALQLTLWVGMLAAQQNSETLERSALRPTRACGRTGVGT